MAPGLPLGHSDPFGVGVWGTGRGGFGDLAADVEVEVVGAGVVAGFDPDRAADPVHDRRWT